MDTNTTVHYLVPNLPLNSNPFLVFDKFFEGIVWPHPPSGYHARLILLNCLVCYMAAVALAVLVALGVSRSDRLWAFRLIKREEGRFIVGNALVIVPLFALALVPSFIGNNFTDNDTYRHHGEQSSSDTWSVSVFPILFVGSWLWSCSGLQAFILAGGSRRMPVGPKTANTVFLGGLIAGVAIMTSLAIVGSRISREKSASFFRMDHFVHLHWEQYDEDGGIAYPGDVKELYRLAEEYDDAVDSYQAVFIKLLYVFAATPFCIGFINLATLALFFVVRRQVSDSRATFHPFRFASATHQHVRSEAAVAPISQLRSAQSQTNEEQMGRLRALEEVQTELLISCLAHYFFILALFASTIWTATQFQNQGLTGWSKMEAISLLPTWICSVFFSSFLSVRLYRTIRSHRRALVRQKAFDQSPPRPTFLQLPPPTRTEPTEKAEAGSEVV